MSTAERHESLLLPARKIDMSQHRWPTLGWALGELRWYAIGAAAGGAVAVGAFVVWLVLNVHLSV
jgi:hypothetical protein